MFCCIALGKSSVSRFSLREFDTWYIFLKRDTIESKLVTEYFSIPTSFAADLDRFSRGENMNFFFYFDVVHLLFKNNRDRVPSFVILFSTECFECQRLANGGLLQRVLFRAG